MLLLQKKTNKTRKTAKKKKKEKKIPVPEKLIQQGIAAHPPSNGLLGDITVPGK